MKTNGLMEVTGETQRGGAASCQRSAFSGQPLGWWRLVLRAHFGRAKSSRPAKKRRISSTETQRKPGKPEAPFSVLSATSVLSGFDFVFVSLCVSVLLTAIIFASRDNFPTSAISVSLRQHTPLRSLPPPRPPGLTLICFSLRLSGSAVNILCLRLRRAVSLW